MKSIAETKWDHYWNQYTIYQLAIAGKFSV